VLGDDAIESIFHLDRQANAIAAWSRAHGLKRVAIADFSKNLYATFRGCREAGLDVRAIVDRNPAFAGITYRGTPINAAPPAVDGVVLSNVNPAQVERRVLDLCRTFDGPILRLWEPRKLGPRVAPQPIEIPTLHAFRQSA
jgi:hypothetical protein